MWYVNSVARWMLLEGRGERSAAKKRQKKIVQLFKMDLKQIRLPSSAVTEREAGQSLNWAEEAPSEFFSLKKNNGLWPGAWCPPVVTLPWTPAEWTGGKYHLTIHTKQYSYFEDTDAPRILEQHSGDSNQGLCSMNPNNLCLDYMDLLFKQASLSSVILAGVPFQVLALRADCVDGCLIFLESQYRD